MTSDTSFPPGIKLWASARLKYGGALGVARESSMRRCGGGGGGIGERGRGDGTGVSLTPVWSDMDGESFVLRVRLGGVGRGRAAGGTGG